MRTSISFRNSHPEVICLFPELKVHYNFEDYTDIGWENEEKERKYISKTKKKFSKLMKNLGFTEQVLVDPMWSFYNPITGQTYNHFQKQCDLKKDAPLKIAENCDTFIQGGMITEQSYYKLFPNLKHFIGSGNCMYEPDEDDIENYGEPVITSLFWENPKMMLTYTAFVPPNNFPYNSTKITAPYVKENFQVTHHSTLKELFSYYQKKREEDLESETDSEEDDEDEQE